VKRVLTGLVVVALLLSVVFTASAIAGSSASPGGAWLSITVLPSPEVLLSNKLILTGTVSTSVPVGGIGGGYIPPATPAPTPTPSPTVSPSPVPTPTPSTPVVEVPTPTPPTTTAPTPSPTPQPVPRLPEYKMPWWLVGVIGACVVILVALIVYKVRTRKKAS